jgi:hypothetical protein
MKTKNTTLRLTAFASMLAALALAAGPSGAAESRIPELGNADPPPRETAPAPKLRASFVLVQAGSGPCGTETYAFEVNGRRLALAC